MQGKLSEIDIRSILQLIELGQRTGQLFVETYSSQSNVELGSGQSLPSKNSQPLTNTFWFVFFLNGRIIYAADMSSNTNRLRDYLRRYQLDHVLNQLTVQAIAATNAPEYGYLWALLEKHSLTPDQGRSIIHSMVHETLFDLFNLHQGSFIFEVSPPLSPQLTTLEIAPQLARTMKRIQQWKLLHPYIQTPEQRPSIADVNVLQNVLSNRTFKTLTEFMDGKSSIRQIARYLNRDIVTVAKAIYPYVQQGIIQLSYSQGEAPSTETASRPTRTLEAVSWSGGRSPKIVCIDDGATVREMVYRMLVAYGYEVTTIADPLEALGLVFRINPDLILCDITMPELDGYEVCAMLRTATAFRQTPIIMLTGKDGFIDRVRARMIGATDYLTKPFGEHELLMLIEKYVGLGYPEPQQNSQIVDPLAEDLKMDRTDATSPSSAPLN